MTDWNRLALNAKASGHFAGRSISDEDAYYTAFTGDEAGELRTLSKRMSAKVRGLIMALSATFGPAATNGTGWASMR